MLERIMYQRRRDHAEKNKENVMSIITDGFAQTHSILPWLGNRNSHPVTCEQKMIGALVHGHSFHIYRCFENVADGANLNIYIFLSELENWVSQNKGRFPKKIFWQVDGGSENANKFCLMICELLIARTGIEEILLTRLPVGHTHEGNFLS